MAIIGLAGRKVSALAREVGSACLAVAYGQEIGGPTPVSPKSDISNNVGPVKLFLNTLLSFHLKELFSFVLFCFVFFPASTTTTRL